jgi:hypothetical protein
MVVNCYRLGGHVNSIMLYEFSLPTKADKVAVGSDWIHEIKYDGFCNGPVCVNPSFRLRSI